MVPPLHSFVIAPQRQGVTRAALLRGESSCTGEGQKAAPRHVGLESQDRRGQGKWRERGVTPEGGPGEGAGADARALSSCICAQVCLRHMGFLGYLTGFVADPALIHTSLSLSD